MQDIEPDAIVNRGKPIAVLQIGGESSKRHGSAKDSGKTTAPKEARENDTINGVNSLQERALNAILSQMFPSAGEQTARGQPDKTLDKNPSVRPQFSLPTMSTNFRRFNARIGVVFAFQGKVERLFAWETPTHTLSFLAVYSLITLNPRLLLAMPLAICLLFMLIPAYLSRHPPPADQAPTEVFDITGPALAPARNIKPAPEMSHDFFRNMRDLQNSMADFTVVHDLLVSQIGPATNFSDERKSSALFISLFITCCTLFIAADLIPLRATLLVLGWITIGSKHPGVQAALASIVKQNKVLERQADAPSKAYSWIQDDIVLDEAPEVREVEVFELQHQNDTGEWVPWLFSSSPHTPLSPARISGERPVGTPFFEDVNPPKGWEWKSKKWDLDLLSRDWVEERTITGVEVETEGERWVYDMNANAIVQPGTAKRKDPKVPRQGWEETLSAEKKGEWRRRRWTRLVKRKIMKI